MLTLWVTREPGRALILLSHSMKSGGSPLGRTKSIASDEALPYSLTASQTT